MLAALASEYVHDCHDFFASIQSLDRSDMLRSTEAFNHILQAVTRIPVVGAHYTTYNDMIANHVDPNLHTFHLLLDGTLAEGSVKNTKKAAYFLWRSLMKEWPRVKPEIELINKFIRCCLVCSDQERAFVFLAALEDCSVEPNFDTFSLLFKVYTCTCIVIYTITETTIFCRLGAVKLSTLRPTLDTNNVKMVAVGSCISLSVLPCYTCTL